MLTREFTKPLQHRLLEPAPLLQVLLGPRQVGKTTAARYIYDHWSGPKLMISADEPSPPTPEWITTHWQQIARQGPGGLFIIDEVQKVPGWSERIKALFDPVRGTGQLKVLLLGSSSLFLQRGLRESLAGRFELIQAPHWSYRECRDAFGWDLDTYLRFGAYPSSAPYIQDEARWRAYILHSIIEPVIGRDLLGLAPVTQPALFRQAFELAVHYPAQVVSLQKLLGQLQDRGNVTTVKHYLALLEQAYLIRCLQKYSGSMIRSRSSSPKIVVLNPALTHAYQAQARLAHDPTWNGLMFESMIGAHLAQRVAGTLYYWRDGQDEVDYVVVTPQATLAIEIKSGHHKKTTRGLQTFARRYPDVLCQTWDYARCLEFLETDQWLRR
ncbi:MAG: ATP-binding protein [Deltaproteobacteria bacterium]|nr:ATP-binding protein [Deltaproteobacteria bacterium]